jgi:hypothetical protein
MGDEKKLRRSFFAHIEHKADEVWKSIDDLQKAMETAPTAERSGPECDTNEKLSKRFLAWISTERYSPNSRTAPSQSAESLAC